MVTACPVPPSEDVIARAGTLLIRTLTSLKHQGAAYGAHKALQEIAAFCIGTNNDVLRELPSQWAQRLLHEISSSENVRDSTLRRSTGFALGFMAVMRSEPPQSVAPRAICPHILSSIVRLSLPAEEAMSRNLNKWNLEDVCSTGNLFAYGAFRSTSVQLYVPDEEYEVRKSAKYLGDTIGC